MERRERARLDRYRLERGWSWQQLSDAMARLNIELSPRTLHYIVKGAPVGYQPHDRTLYKIKRFWKRMRDTEVRRKSRRKALRKPVAGPASVTS